MSINSDREFYLMVSDKAKAHWARVGAGEDFILMRGKDRRFIEYLTHGTSKTYFERYAESVQ